MQVNDLIPISSGLASLGIDQGPNTDAFDITSLAPFNRYHTISGVYHDPILGQSGVIRYSRAASAFQVSVDGGLTFNNISTGAGSVTSVGVLGGANLTGDVDFASPSSGFISIIDTGGLSPLLWSVNQLGLSGLWKFPSQGFNGSIVNALTDFNGTTAQGVINVVGTSGIVVDIIGQILTITPGPSGGFATCYVQAFSLSNSWVVNHNLNTPHVIVQTYDNSVQANAIIPDRIKIVNSSQVNVTFNTSQAGKVVILACRDIF